MVVGLGADVGVGVGAGVCVARGSNASKRARGIDSLDRVEWGGMQQIIREAGCDGRSRAAERWADVDPNSPALSMSLRGVALVSCLPRLMLWAMVPSPRLPKKSRESKRIKKNWVGWMSC